MCLFKARGVHPLNRPLIAEKDIICYKKLQQVGNDAYVTPCTDTQIPIECIQDKVPFKAEILHKIIFIWRHILGFSDCVEDGFIHTFKEDDVYSSYIVFECIIPKGTKYFIGTNDDYASEQIIFIRRVN